MRTVLVVIAFVFMLLPVESMAQSRVAPEGDWGSSGVDSSGTTGYFPGEDIWGSNRALRINNCAANCVDRSDAASAFCRTQPRSVRNSCYEAARNANNQCAWSCR